MVALEYFRLIATEFVDIDDVTVNAMIDMASAFVSPKGFDNKYEQALAYYTAHLFAMRSIVNIGGSTDTKIIAGNVSSEKEGDLQRSYGSSNITSTGDDLLNRTYYGKLFLMLRKSCIMPVMTRMG